MPGAAVALACHASFAFAAPARADGTVFETVVNGPTIQIWGSGLIHPSCNPALGTASLELYLGTNQLQVVAASSNPSTLPPDYLQGVMPSGASQLVAGAYDLIILCGPRGAIDAKDFTVYVDYAEQDLAKEIARAEATEASIAASLTTEAARATAAEGTVGDQIQAVVASVSTLQSNALSLTPLAPGDPNCPSGGTQFTVGTTTSYACNGASAAQVSALQAKVASLQSQVSALQSLVSTQPLPDGTTFTQLTGPLMVVSPDQSASYLSMDAHGDITVNGKLTTTGGLSFIFNSDSLPTTPGFFADTTGVRVRGLNLYVTNGMDGAQNDFSTTNGLGNLFVGINGTQFRNQLPQPVVTGSHNLIVGAWNSASAYGAIVAGDMSLSAAPFASVLGGVANTAAGPNAVVVGGAYNTASGAESAILGGGGTGFSTANVASGPFSTVCGGAYNTASGANASILGAYGVSVDTNFGTSP
jgi:hypothetical protein